MSWASWVGALAVWVLGAGPALAIAWPACVARRAPVRIGIRALGRSVHGRPVTYTLRSRAMGDVQHVNVLLPAHFDRSGRTRYPVLYLLRGVSATTPTGIGSSWPSSACCR